MVTSGVLFEGDWEFVVREGRGALQVNAFRAGHMTASQLPDAPSRVGPQAGHQRRSD